MTQKELEQKVIDAESRVAKREAVLFPSPCGVWVVSAKLHILSGATGKRIVNSAVLLYHIGRCLSITN